MFVEYVTLEPNLRIECGANCKGSTQCATVNQHFEFDAFEIEMNPEELAAGERIP